MPTPTTRLGLLKPTTADPFVTQDIADNWQKIDDAIAIDGQGTFANRPAAGQQGRYYYATDTGLVYRDDGSTWKAVGHTLHDNLGDRDNVGAHPQYALKAGGANTFTGTPQVNTNAIWHAGNDGAGSGLDADKLDGSHASAFATSGHTHSGVYAPNSHTHSYAATTHKHVDQDNGIVRARNQLGSRHYHGTTAFTQYQSYPAIRVEAATITIPGDWASYDLFVNWCYQGGCNGDGTGQRIDTRMRYRGNYINIGGDAQPYMHEVPGAAPGTGETRWSMVSGVCIATGETVTGTHSIEIRIQPHTGFRPLISDNIVIAAQAIRLS